MRTFFVTLILFFYTQIFATGIQPNNFFQVDKRVLRGAAVTPENIMWLSEKGVKTIIKLDDRNPDELSGIIPVDFLPISRIGLDLTYDYAMRILSRIEQAKRRGLVYIHCEKGADRTGVIVALYRVIHGWSIDAARSEMNNPRFGHSPLQVLMDMEFEEYSRLLVENQFGGGGW